MRTFLGLLVAATLASSGALAQSVPSTGHDAAAQPAQATAPSPAQGKLVEGVTVTGRRPPAKTCSPRDQACIATVVAELKARYPQELQKWCNHVEERAAMNTIMFMEIDLDRPHPNVGPYTPPAVAKSACAPDKKP